MRVILSTDGIPEKERFDCWREMVSQPFPALRIERKTHESFFARAEFNQIDNIQFITIHSAPHHGFLSRQAIARAPEEFYVVNLQLEGTSFGEQKERHWVTQPGDIDFLDTRKPAAMGTDEAGRGFLMLIPHHKLRPLLAHPDDVAGMRLPKHGPTADLASACMHALARHQESFGSYTGPAINVCIETLAMAIGATTDAIQQAKPSLREARRHVIREHIKNNLADPSLSPAKLAAQFHMSPRYLHGLFAEVGESPMRLVWSLRLERCRQDLANPLMIARTIADIAFAWGFNDLSHFSRAFKAAYKMTPREWRIESQRNDRES